MESLSHPLTLTVKHYKKFSQIQAQSGITTHVRVRAHDLTHNRTHKQEHVPVPIKSKANHKAPHPHSPQHHAPIQMALHTLALCLWINMILYQPGSHYLGRKLAFTNPTEARNLHTTIALIAVC